jgi:hypothetical protein
MHTFSSRNGKSALCPVQQNGIFYCLVLCDYEVDGDRVGFRRRGGASCASNEGMFAPIAGPVMDLNESLARPHKRGAMERGKC